MEIEEEVQNKILTDATAELESQDFNTITYTSVKESRYKKMIMTLAKGCSINTGFQNGDACVYAIYDQEDDNKPLYVGSSLNVNVRLGQHLVKNDEALSDGSYVKESSTRSKLVNVYNWVKDKEIKQIFYKVISVTPKEYYTAVESLLIKEFKLKGNGWNKRS